MRASVMLGLGFGFLGSAAMATAPGANLNFLACPQLHDTTPNCWTADYLGETYYIGAQRGPDQSYLPQMKHQVLVEGVITDAPRICGGLVMKPLRVSVMPELDLSCDGPVGSGEGLTPPEPATRGTIPRNPIEALPPEIFGHIGTFMRTPLSPAPYEVREFRVDFDFGTDILVDQMQKRMIEIFVYAKAADAKRIAVQGYSATTLLSDGTQLREAGTLAEQRATKVAGMFADLGLPKDAIEVTWSESPEQPDGIHDAGRRRVIVTVEPSAPAGGSPTIDADTVARL